MSERELQLVYLYPRLMSTYGDRGNVLTLERRCRLRGIGFETVHVGHGDGLPQETDLVFWGGGQDAQQEVCSRDLFGGPKAERLREWAEAGVVMLLVCGGYQLMGESFTTADGERIAGTGYLPLRSEGGDLRMIGNMAAKVGAGIPELEGETLVGFENHSGRTLLQDGAEPLGRVLTGGGNNGEDGTAGCVKQNVVGCYLHGPLLPHNPALADVLISRALERKYGDGDLQEIEENFANAARRRMLDRAGARF